MRVATIVSFLFLLGPLPVLAVPQIVNGDFSDGTNGWFEATFDGITISSQGGVVPGPAGQHALISDIPPSGAATLAGLEFNMCLENGQLETTFGAQFTDGSGSALDQESITGNAGDKITFDWNFLTNDTIGQDLAIVSLSDMMNGGTDANVFLLSTNSGLTGGPSPDGFNFSSGPNTFTLTLPTTSTYNLGFAVIQSVDDPNNPVSALAVTNVKGFAAPEIDAKAGRLPLALCLGTLCLLGL